jgi:hypothetical protein
MVIFSIHFGRFRILVDFLATNGVEQQHPSIGDHWSTAKRRQSAPD